MTKAKETFLEELKRKFPKTYDKFFDWYLYNWSHNPDWRFNPEWRFFILYSFPFQSGLLLVFNAEHTTDEETNKIVDAISDIGGKFTTDNIITNTWYYLENIQKP